MEKNKYIRPAIEALCFDPEEMMQGFPGASQFDNDGDGNTDQRPPIIGDPTGGIGAKWGLFEEEEEDARPSSGSVWD